MLTSSTSCVNLIKAHHCSTSCEQRREMDSAGPMQSQLRQNNEELLDYLKGLESWEEEMREKDQTLVKNRSILKEVHH